MTESSIRVLLKKKSRIRKEQKIMERKNKIARGAVAAVCCIAVTATAQDFSSLFQSAINNRATELVNFAIRSVADVTMGRVNAGAPAPQDAEGKVVLYRTSWCGYCTRAAAYMQQKNIPFVERDIEANSSYKAEYTRLGGKGPVPFLVFGTQTMQGFSTSGIDTNYAAYQRSLASASQSGNGTAMFEQPGQHQGNNAASLQAGDTLVGKIGGVKVHAHASKDAPSLQTAGRMEEMVYMGEERDGLYRVTTTQGEGWVDKLLVRKPLAPVSARAN